MKKLLSAAAALVLASVALCQVSKYKDWPKSPEAYFLTPAEKQEWSQAHLRRGRREVHRGLLGQAGRGAVQGSDHAAHRRRRPAVQAAPPEGLRVGSRPDLHRAREPDQGVGGTRGRAAPPGHGRGELRARAPGNFEAESGPTAVVQTWIYAKDKFDPSWDVGEFQARISVDPQRGTDELHERRARQQGDREGRGAFDRRSRRRCRGRQAGRPPGGDRTGDRSSPAAAPPAPVAVALPAAPRAILEPLLKEPSRQAFQRLLGRRIPDRHRRAVLRLSDHRLRQEGRSRAPGMKLGGIVTREDGQEATSFWEDAAPVEHEGSGGYRQGRRPLDLASAPGSTPARSASSRPTAARPLASASTTFTISEKSSDFKVSPLILAAVLTPLTKRPDPTDAFVFGMEKPIRVEPQGNGLFKREDGLWYFFTVANPAVAAEAAAAAPPPADPAAAAAPAPDAAAKPAPMPRIMTRLGVLRDGKPAFQPTTLPAELQPLAPNFYANGSEIPLASFEPGYYTFTLNVRDLNAPRDSAAFKGVDRTGDFVVLMPDGALPPVPTPAAAKPTPKPKPKKS